MLTTLSRAAVLACAVAVSVSAQAPRAGYIDLRYGAFDPLASQLEVPAALRSQDRHQMHIVQFWDFVENDFKVLLGYEGLVLK